MAQPAKPSPLGRGLSALFGDTDSSYKARTAPAPSGVVPAAHAPSPNAVAAASAAVSSTLSAIKAPPAGQGAPLGLSITQLNPGAFQPRRHFDEDALKGLAESIRERGILEPLVVRPVAGGKDGYEIIAGERRWRAAQMAGLHEVPVIVRNLTDREALEFGLIENVQRQDLSPLEEAEGYRRLMDEFQHTQEGLAKIVGKSRPHITNMLRILTLPEDVRHRIERGELTLGHARAIVVAKNPGELAEIIVRKGLNVRQAEELARKAQDNPQIHKRHASTTQAEADALALEKEVEKTLGLKVKIAVKGKSGSLTIFYHDLDQLDELIRKLKG